MLKGIDPLLNADVLQALAAMGHGDELVIVDSNFPADSIARRTAIGKLLRIDADIGRAARAVLSLFPLDTFVDYPARRMQVVGKPDEIPAAQADVQKVIDAAEGRSVPLGSIERMQFYEVAKRAYCVIQTTEGRPYGVIILTKGVITPGR